MRIAFRVDATERIGGGHVMRCLTLANALRELGAETTFVSAALPASLRERLAGAGHPLQMMAAPADFGGDGDHWHEPPLGEEAQSADAAATLATLDGPADWMVVDHYLLGRPWHAAVRDGSKRLLVIDDLANRPLDCDVVLDQTFGRSADDYRDLVPRGAQVLAGTTFALLRPEFTRERPAALQRRRKGGAVGRILISLGTTDVGGITAQAVECVMSSAPDCAIEVALGEETASFAKVRDIAASHGRVKLHVGTDDMARLMRDADVAIGAAGTTSWERCCLGLPSLTLVLAGNQEAIASRLADVGASITVEGPEAISERLAVLLAEPEMLQSMSAAAFALVDGLGTERVAGTMLERPIASPGKLHLRGATEADAQILWLWRNDPQARLASQSSSGPIPWPAHERWVADALSDPKTRLFIAERDGLPIGMVRFDDANGGHEVSINMRPDARGKGVGGRILEEACRKFAGRDPAPLIAIIHGSNTPSRHIFEKCGFEDHGTFGERGYRRYLRPGGADPGGTLDEPRVPDWWQKPRPVSVCVDTPGWFDEFAAELVARLNQRGDDAVFIRSAREVKAGGVAFYLSCMKLTPLEILELNRQNIVVHASTLPHGRGFSPVVWQVLEGRDQISVTMMLAAEEADSGNILMVDQISLQGHELNDEIRTLLGRKIVDMCLAYLDAPAPSAGRPQLGEASWYACRRAEDSKLDPDRSLAEQFDLLRVVDNDRYPAFFDYRGHRYILRIERDKG